MEIPSGPAVDRATKNPGYTNMHRTQVWCAEFGKIFAIWYLKSLYKKSPHLGIFLMRMWCDMQNQTNKKQNRYCANNYFLGAMWFVSATMFTRTPAIAQYQIPRQRQHAPRKHKQPRFQPMWQNMKMCCIWCNQPHNRQQHRQTTTKNVWQYRRNNSNFNRFIFHP